MIALVRTERNAVEVRELPAPALSAPDQVRVRVKAAAVCTTDLAIVSGAFGGSTPRVLGHEVAGEVVEIGPAVRNIAIGDHVALQPTIYCGTCACCRQGDWHLCPQRRFVGLDTDGGFAETMVVPAANLTPVAPALPFRYACMGEPLACVLHAVDCLAGVKPRGVVITGAGTSAYLFARVLIANGLAPERILVSGRREKRLAIIRALGAQVVDIRRAALASKVAEVFGADNPDLFIDQTGDPRVLREASDLLQPRGTLFIYDFTGHAIPFNFGVAQLREIAIKTSTGCPGATMRRALDLMQQGLDVSPVITHVYAPPDMKQAFEKLTVKDAGHVKSVIVFE